MKFGHMVLGLGEVITKFHSLPLFIDLQAKLTSGPLANVPITRHCVHVVGENIPYSEDVHITRVFCAPISSQIQSIPPDIAEGQPISTIFDRSADFSTFQSTGMRRNPHIGGAHHWVRHMSDTRQHRRAWPGLRTANFYLFSSTFAPPSPSHWIAM